MKFNQTINVMRVITWLPVGGIERRLVALLPRLNEPPFNVSLCCIRERGDLADELEQCGVPVFLSPLRSRLEPRGILRLARLFKAQNIDIVHSHMYRSNVPAAIAAKIAGVPIIISNIHNMNTWETRRQLWMEKVTNRFRDAIVAVSGEVGQNIRECLSADSKKIQVIYNGSDLKRFTVPVDRKEYLGGLGIPNDAIVITTVARLKEQKNHRGCLLALKPLIEKHHNLHYLVVGGGDLEEQLRQLAEELKIAQNCHFIGVSNDIPRILRASDIFLLASFKEGFSNAIVEAMAAGLPVVASNRGGNPEAVIHGENGFIVDPDDARDIEEKLSLLVDDALLRRQMAVKSKEYVQRFSIEKMLADTRELYLELAAQKLKEARR